MSRAFLTGFLAAVLTTSAAAASLWIADNRLSSKAVSIWEIVVNALGHWDAGWYIKIAEQGYWYQPGEQSPVAFFPLFPMAIRGLSFLGLSPNQAGVLISATFGLLSLALFAYWARLKCPDQDTHRALLLLIFYPFSFYLYGVIYSDGLFLFLALGAFVLLERGAVTPAALVGALATATRPVAPALVIGLLIRQWEIRRERGERLRSIDWVPLIAAGGLATYVGFLWCHFGEPLAFAKVQAVSGWGNSPELKTWLKFVFFDVLSSHWSTLVKLRLVFHALIAICALALVIPTKRFLGWGYACYVAIAVGLPAVCSKDFHGLGRYALGAFPCFLTATVLLERVPRLRRVWVLSNAVLLFALAAAFGRGKYIA